MHITAAKKTNYVQSAWVTNVPDLTVFYSILFYSMSLIKTPKMP